MPRTSSPDICSRAETATERERKWSVGCVANLIKLSYPWASLHMKRFDRREWLSCCVDWRSVGLTHVSICRLPLQPNAHTVESGRSNVHILILIAASWAGLTVDGPSDNKHALSVRFLWRHPLPAPHISVAQWWKYCSAIDWRVVCLMILNRLKH